MYIFSKSFHLVWPTDSKSLPKYLPNRLNETHLFLLSFSAPHVFQNVLCVKWSFSERSFAAVFYRTEPSRAADTQNLRSPGVEWTKTRETLVCSLHVVKRGCDAYVPLCGRSRALNISLIKIRNFYSPILCNFTWGFQQISSMTRCRSISSSYWTIVVLKTLKEFVNERLNAAAEEIFKLSTELIVFF